MTLELDEDEAAFSLSIAYFERMGGEPTLVVGTAVSTTLVPRACKEGWLRVYAIRDGGRSLEFMHKVSPSTRRIDRVQPDEYRPKRTIYRCVLLDSRAIYWLELGSR